VAPAQSHNQRPSYQSGQLAPQIEERRSWSSPPPPHTTQHAFNTNPHPQNHEDDLLSALTRQRDEINAKIAALQSGKSSYQPAPVVHPPQHNAPFHFDLSRESDTTRNYSETSRRIDFDEGRSEAKSMYVSEYLPSSQRVPYVSSWNDHPTEINDRVVADYTGAAFSNNDFYFNSTTFDNNDNPLCSCGTPAVKLISKTSANMNREFYKCAAPNEANRCQFFQWVDGDSVSAVSHQYDPSANKDYMAANKRIFGHNRFREGQKECIEAALQGLVFFFPLRTLCLILTCGRKRCVLFNAYRWWEVSCVSTPCLLLCWCLHCV
jgi:hypothetical protein